MTALKTTLASVIAALLIAQPSYADDVASGLIKAGTLTIATTGNAPPMTMMQQDGALGGFDIALCTRIAQNLGLTPKFVRVDFSATIPGLKAGRFDMICSAVARTPARLESPDLFLSDPTIENFTTLVVTRGSDIATTDAAKGKNIGVVRGGQEAKLLAQVFADDVTVKTYPGIAEEMLDLKNGRVDAVAMNYTTAMYHAKSEPDLVVLEPGFQVDGVSPYQHGLVVSRNEPLLLDAVNAQLAALSGDGTLAALKAEWITGK